ncbi:hypothetical protein BpHYR1_032351, partial [Brachionus plicatilis]
RYFKRQINKYKLRKEFFDFFNILLSRIKHILITNFFAKINLNIILHSDKLSRALSNSESFILTGEDLFSTDASLRTKCRPVSISSSYEFTFASKLFN